MSEYSDSQGLEKFMALETTRGCPYKCVYCEWGGGTGTKIHKKPLGIVKDDIDCLRSMGYRDVYLTDANFGAFEERDLEIFEYAWKNKIILTDISTMKAKDLGRRTRFFDACFDIIGPCRCPSVCVFVANYIYFYIHIIFSVGNMHNIIAFRRQSCAFL